MVIKYREYKIDSTDKKFVHIIRTLCTGKHLYTFWIVSLAKDENSYETNKFFKSFKLL